MYGYITIFGASMPLAPLIFALFLFLDLGFDAKRFVNTLQRCTAARAQDIGSWYPILVFTNTVAVVANGFMLALSSRFGNEMDRDHGEGSYVWVIVIFEHVVFVLKMVLAYVIPDTPGAVRVAIRRERWETEVMFGEAEAHKEGGEASGLDEEVSLKDLRHALKKIPKASDSLAQLDGDKMKKLERRHSRKNKKSKKGRKGDEEKRKKRSSKRHEDDDGDTDGDGNVNVEYDEEDDDGGRAGSRRGIGGSPTRHSSRESPAVGSTRRASTRRRERLAERSSSRSSARGDRE